MKMSNLGTHWDYLYNSKPVRFHFKLRYLINYCIQQDPQLVIITKYSHLQSQGQKDHKVVKYTMGCLVSHQPWGHN